ncbi:GNAT family protein [Streptomyces sp. W1SF4]|uniref:GNAT family N-acetyltransferase n=1 Tax=Streptomyces sp. W1SF4 TaxID=2305220 RepID=UPI000F70487F|nr:GNAT family protein [Streptomyces sp. W1SF4]AZM93848.1 N-acetyltransferase [Streptomyces sp. W1SF4]
MDPVTLSDDRLILRPMRPSDAGHVLAGWQDETVRRWTEVPAEPTLRQARAFVEVVCAQGWQDATNLIFAAELKRTGEFVGSLGVFGLSWAGLSEQLAWVGYWTAAGQRGRGHTSAALRMMSAWAFGALGVDRLEAVVEVGNDASLACAERAGYVLEGTHRARTVQNGSRRDAWVAALLPQDLDRPSSVPYPCAAPGPPHPAGQWPARTGPAAGTVGDGRPATGAVRLPG